MSERLRLFFWPRRSFSRSLRYMGKRLMRISASPHAIAAGLAVGIFAAFTPFWGLHVVIAIVLAYLIAGNLAAAALGTAFANPLTVPFIWGSTYELGTMVLNGDETEAHSDVAKQLAQAFQEMHLAEIWTPLLKPMLFGSMILGAAFALIVYFVTRYAVMRARERRRLRLAQRCRKNASCSCGCEI